MTLSALSVLSAADLTPYFDIAPPATEEEMAAAEAHFGYSFPPDYKAFLRISNGLEGYANDEYLVIWSATELIELNEAYKVLDFIGNIIIFGSDGAEDAYAFDISRPDPAMVKLPFIGMGHIPNQQLAYSFENFLIPRIKLKKNFFKRLFG